MRPAFLLFLAYVPLSILMDLVTYLLAPFLAALSMIVGPVLPYPLSLFHSADDDLDGGQHQNGWDRDASGFKLYCQRVYWMWRNPAGGFNTFVLGQKEATMTTWISTEKGNKTAYMRNEDGDFFSIQKDLYWSKTKYCKIWIGWKPEPARDGIRDIDLHYHTMKFSINPFKTGVRP